MNKQELNDAIESIMNTDNMIAICTQEIIEWNESLFCPCDAGI